jgi:hypothetical protein
MAIICEHGHYESASGVVLPSSLFVNNHWKVWLCRFVFLYITVLQQENIGCTATRPGVYNRVAILQKMHN